MTGTVVVTGPNGGMTNITVKQYAKSHPEDHMILLVRNPSKLPSGSLPPSDKIHYQAFDMTNLTAVRQAASDIAGKVSAGTLPRIRSLVCSAAIQVTQPTQPHLTVDGYEETVAVNHLAHLALILDLLPSMASDGQVIIVGSESHRPDYKYMPRNALYRPLRELVIVKAGSQPAAEARPVGIQRYGTSKLLQIMTGHELARRLAAHPTYSHVKVAMFNPGTMGGTGLVRDFPYIAQLVFGVLFNFPRVLNWLDPAIQVTLKEDSAASLLRIMEDRRMAEAEPVGPTLATGGAPHYGPDGVLVQTYGEANEPEKARELWEDSIALLGIGKEKGLEM